MHVPMIGQKWSHHFRGPPAPALSAPGRVPIGPVRGTGVGVARLLVVDNEPDICALIARYLVRAGHEVICAHDSATALAEVALHGPPDAAVLDVDMPAVDGFELLERLRADHPDLAALFLTVLWHGNVLARIAGLDAAYVAKPFTPGALCSAVDELLARRGGASRQSETAR
jgi:two-component system, OmpR family, response regulator